MKNRRLKIAVGLSGGVDSSVAAILLKEEGHKVMGISMEIFDGSMPVNAPERHTCYGPGEKKDIEIAASFCKDLGIPFYTLDLKNKFRDHVIKYFKREYLKGRTPNPCVVCNQQIKFGFLLEKARIAGVDFDLFATGHYARIVKYNNRFLLKKAKDLSKDQSYFLYTLTPEQLSRTIFPVGSHTKHEVRAIARSLGLVNAERPESQDFIAGCSYSLLFGHDSVKEGPITDEGGNILGRHKGIIHYTVGQRKGLGIASSKPLYVLRIDAKGNRIVVGEREMLRSKGLVAADLNLIAVDRLDHPCKVTAKIRLKHKGATATVFPMAHGRIKLIFDKPQEAVTPGQSVVLFLNDTVLGGGIIEYAL